MGLSIFRKAAQMDDAFGNDPREPSARARRAESMAGDEDRESLIDVSNVTLSYSGAVKKRAASESDDAEHEPLLSGISFTVEPGRLYCIMGANGCGKTTLINCILGMHRQDSGVVYVGGADARKLKPAELAARAAFVPQTHEKTFPYTVEQIVMMGRSVYADALRGPGDDEHAIAADVMQRTGIAHLADRPYTQISGGELQLVMLARALAQQAPVIIMDEPSAHLDFRNELVFMETVAALIRDEGTAVLMATHSPNHPFFFERSGIDTQVLALAGCRLRYIGTPSEILTEERIREIYGIHARVLRDDSGGSEIRQIVPIRTV